VLCVPLMSVWVNRSITGHHRLTIKDRLTDASSCSRSCWCNGDFASAIGWTPLQSSLNSPNVVINKGGAVCDRTTRCNSRWWDRTDGLRRHTGVDLVGCSRSPVCGQRRSGICFLALILPAHHKLALKCGRCRDYPLCHYLQLRYLCSARLGAACRSPRCLSVVR